ncbi:MAG: NAD-binding protein [Candidatus Parvarchaeota archaeon]|jgi:voltage-gated potassium channel|nr:NAD-binding protein [Candidatus Parvarchaeota archaeon]MCL5101600.1 NAD-binding protein [Candidatus Parvarchaeota archaeon]
MDTIRENAQKVLISVIILSFIAAVLVVIIIDEQGVSATDAVASIVLALETFNFKSNFGIILLFFSLFLGVFAVYLLEFLVSFLRNEFGGVIYMAQTIGLKNHYIICGGGRIGERVASLLRERHKTTMIVENDETRAFELKKLGFKVLKENALDEKTFKMANAKHANAVFACLGQDVDNFLVVLNAREASKTVQIFARCNSIKNINKFRQLGANEIVLPEIVGADRMVYLSERDLKK